MDKKCIKCGKTIKRYVFYKDRKYLDSYAIKKATYCSRLCADASRPIRENKIIIVKKVTYLVVKRFDKEILVTIDDESIKKVKSRHWSLTKPGYVVGNIKLKKPIYLHRLIFGDVKKGLVIDHINRNPLDNRKENLRAIPHRINLLNTNSKNIYKGCRAKSYSVKVGNDYLGSFATEALAVKARDEYKERLLAKTYKYETEKIINALKNRLE